VQQTSVGCNQVVALRSLGVPLTRIARALEGDRFTLKAAVTAQLEAVDAELLHARRLRRRLERILEVLESSDDLSTHDGYTRGMSKALAILIRCFPSVPAHATARSVIDIASPGADSLVS
jgi:hypothetical protein